MELFVRTSLFKRWWRLFYSFLRTTFFISRSSRLYKRFLSSGLCHNRWRHDVNEGRLLVPIAC